MMAISAAAFDRARQRERAGHRTHRIEDDVAGVAQPDELLRRQRQHVRKERIQPRVNARQRNDRQFVRKIRRMQAGFRIPGHRPVVRVNDGFEEAHKFSYYCGKNQWM